MKKYSYLLFTLCALFIAQNIDAQKDYAPGKITWGEEHKSPNNSRMAKIIGTTEKGFYSLRISSGGIGGFPKYLVEQFNTKNKVVKAKELEMKYKKKRRDFENIMLLGDKLFLFTSFYNVAKKKKYLFAETLSSISLKQRNDLKMIGEIEEGKVERGVFDFAVSEDSSKIVIYHNLPTKRKAAEQFAFKVFNSDFEELWYKEVTLPYSSVAFQVKEYNIDNQGNVYVLGQNFGDNPRFRQRSTPFYNYSILSYKDNGEAFKEYQVDLKEKFITDLTMKVNDEGDLICAGFFSEQNQNNLKGTCFIKIDGETEELITSNIKEFDFDFLTEYYTEYEKSRAERAEVKGKTNRQAELFRFSLDDLILRSDGGAVLVAEQFFIEQITSNDYYNRFDNRVSYEYNYNDIIVVNINPDGTIEWTSRIPKRQETRDDAGYFSSYSMAIVRDRMYFVYNDNVRNFEERRNNRRFPYRFNGNNSIITLSEITQTGEVKKYALGNNRDEKILTRPKVCEQTGLYEMVVFGERRGKFKFGKLKFVPQ